MADELGMMFDELAVVKCPAAKEGRQYKFLGVLESTRQEDEVVSEVHLKRLSITLSSALSDFHRTLATNQ